MSIPQPASPDSNDSANAPNNASSNPSNASNASSNAHPVPPMMTAVTSRQYGDTDVLAIETIPTPTASQVLRSAMLFSVKLLVVPSRNTPRSHPRIL